jgi:hypothetical protein
MDMTLMKAMRKLQKCLGWNDNEDFELLLICQSKAEGMKQVGILIMEMAYIPIP